MVLILHTSVRYIKEQRNRRKKQTNRTITRRLYSPFKSLPFSVPGIYFLLKRDSGIRGFETPRDVRHRGIATGIVRASQTHRHLFSLRSRDLRPSLLLLSREFPFVFRPVESTIESIILEWNELSWESGGGGHNLGINSVRIIGSFN